MITAKDRRLNIHYSGIQGSYWILAAVYFVFLTPILQDKGFGNYQIGILLAIRSLATMISQLTLSAIADKFAGKIPLKYILSMVICGGILGTTVFLCLAEGFFATCILFVWLGATVFCIAPLMDSLAMEFIDRGRRLNYTACRSIGSVTWAFACIILGWLMQRGGGDSLLIVEIAFLALLFLGVFTMETIMRFENDEESIRKTQEKFPDNKSHSILYLLRTYPNYTLFIVAFFLCYMSSTICNNFQIDVITSLGGDNTWLGYAEFILAISEVPVILFYNPLKKKVGLSWILVMVMFFCTMKVFFQSFAPNLTCHLIAQIFEMLGFGMSYSASLQFVMATVPMADAVKGQGMITVAGTGLGSCVASYLGGILYDTFNLNVMLAVGVIIGIFSVAVMAIAVWYPWKLKKAGTEKYITISSE